MLSVKVKCLNLIGYFMVSEQSLSASSDHSTGCAFHRA